MSMCARLRYDRLRPTRSLRHITVMPRILLPDLAATTALAAALAAIARPGDSLLLEGPFGAGKTTFARAFLRAAARDPALDVPSPSFTLVQIYDSEIGPIFHYDLWRVDNANALTELDWDDARDAIVLVEWPDRLGDLRPTDALTLTFHLGAGQAREITMTGWAGRMPPAIPVSRPSNPTAEDTMPRQPPNAQPGPDSGGIVAVAPVHR